MTEVFQAHAESNSSIGIALAKESSTYGIGIAGIDVLDHARGTVYNRLSWF